MQTSYSQKVIFNAASIRHSEYANFWISEFCHVSVAWVKICVCVPNFEQFGPFAAELWKYNDFQNCEIGIFIICACECASSLKFRLSRTIWSPVLTKNDFQYGVRPSSSIWEFWKFSHVFVARIKICVCIPNFVIFGQRADEVWRYNDLQNGGRPPSRIFEIGHFKHRTFVCVRLCLRTPNFVLIGQYRQKWFSTWRPSAIFNLGISEFLLCFLRLRQN